MTVYPKILTTKEKGCIMKVLFNKGGVMFGKNRMPNYWREMFWYKVSRVKKWFRKQFQNRQMLEN